LSFQSFLSCLFCEPSYQAQFYLFIFKTEVLFNKGEVWDFYTTQAASGFALQL
jgi:hypothetical protein